MECGWPCLPEWAGPCRCRSWTSPADWTQSSGHRRLSRLGGAGLVRRGQLVAPPAGATVLARFSDGLPAVARVGNITFATSDQSRDWSRWIEEAVRIDWAATKDESGSTYGDPFGMQDANHASGDPVQADGAQIAASLLRQPQASTPPQIHPPLTSGRRWRRGGAAGCRPTEPRLLSYQLRNWMGMLLAEGRLAVPANAEHVVVPAPTGDPSPLTTHLRADRWLRAALLDDDGAVVRDYLEARVDARPPVEVLLLAQRRPPARSAENHPRCAELRSAQSHLEPGGRIARQSRGGAGRANPAAGDVPQHHGPAAAGRP